MKANNLFGIDFFCKKLLPCLKNITLVQGAICAVLAVPLTVNAETTTLYKGGVPLINKNTEGGRYIARYGQYTAIGTEWDQQRGNNAVNKEDQLGSVTVYADNIKNPVAYYTFNNAIKNSQGQSKSTLFGSRVAITEKWIVMLATPFAATTSAFVVAPREGQHWKTCPKVNGFTNCDGVLNVVTGVPTDFSNASISASLDQVALLNGTNKIRLYNLPKLASGTSLATAFEAEITLPESGTVLNVALEGKRLAASTQSNLYIYQQDGSAWILKTPQPYRGGKVSLFGEQLAVTNNTASTPYTYFTELDSQGKFGRTCELSGTGYSMIEMDYNVAVARSGNSLLTFNRRNFPRDWFHYGAVTLIGDMQGARNIGVSGGKIATGLFNLWSAQDGFPFNANGGALTVDITDTSCPQSSTEVKAVSALASSSENSNFTPAKAIDGIDTPTSRWSSAFVDNAWITFDLGKSQLLDRMSISWEAAFSRVYQVQISSDNVNWVLLHNEVSGAPGIKNINFPGQSVIEPVTGTGVAAGRYVRIFMTKRGTSWGNSIQEVKFYSHPSPVCNLPTPILNCTGEQLAPTRAPSTNFYAVQSVNSGKVLDVRDRGIISGTKLQQWDNFSSTNQRFSFIVTGEPGKIAIFPQHANNIWLTIADFSVANGAAIQIANSTTGTIINPFTLNDRYKNGEYEIVTPSGKCVSVENASTLNGANIVQSTCISAPHQRWKLVP